MFLGLPVKTLGMSNLCRRQVCSVVLRELLNDGEARLERCSEIPLAQRLHHRGF